VNLIAHLCKVLAVMTSGTASADVAPAVKPNILLITLDSVRPDHVGCYGYGRQTTPCIDALAREGVLFSRAYSTSNWTIPAHASLLTGCLARTHGSVHFANAPPIRKDIPTLAEVLQEAGYATSAVVSCTTLNGWYGLGRGFDVYDDYSVLMIGEEAGTATGQGFNEHTTVLGTYTTGQAVRLLRRMVAGAKPFFLFVHYYDPHYFYVAVPPFRSRFVRPYAGAVEGTHLWDYRNNAASLSAADLGHLQDLYDAEIAQTDMQVGRLLAECKRLGVYDKTLIWIATDHGQEFGEHGGLLHGHSLHEELVRVAMIVRPPGHPSHGKVDALASLADFMPTAIEMARVGEVPGLEGLSLAPLLRGQTSDSVRRRSHVIVESFTETAVIGERYKLLVRQDGPERWYDLSSDALEARQLSMKSAPGVEAFRIIAQSRQAIAVAGQSQPASGPAIPEELAKRLRDLGYIQ
jgi:arylsulfatase A-like enzyme